MTSYSSNLPSNPLRIGIDARLYNESGVGRYIRNLIFHLQEIDHVNEYFIFLLKKDFDELSFATNFQKVETDLSWYGFSEQIKFPPIIKKLKLDLVHFTHFNVPIFYKGKFVVTIHDLIHQHINMRRATTHGAIVQRLKQIGYKKTFDTALKKSQGIITVSKAVKQQLLDEWDIDNEKITITYEAVEENLLNLAKNLSKEKIDQALKKFNIKFPFIFYAGNAHPHKNIEGLIRAFLKLKEKNPKLQLVLAGRNNFFWQRIKSEYKQKDIVYTGYVSDEELVALYKSASVYAFPSLEEGFGIPLLEAMAIGTAVASSCAKALKEVGGDACIYFDPKNTDDMVEKLDKVLNEEKFKKDLINKGDKRYKKFSWNKMAEQTLEVYKKCV